MRIFLIVALALFLYPVVGKAQTPAKPDIIEVLEISGEINRYTASAIKDQVEKINDTPKVKGVLLVVNSPGGGATASAVLYQEIAKIKVPVVGFCEYICASGGVYALMSPSVKYIAVSDETIGGSVGVVMQMTRFNRLLEWAKIDNETFKSAPLKDAGNPTRAGTEEERAYLQSIIDTLAVKFYGVVKKGRPQADMKEVATAKIFIGEQMVKVGLADAVMSRDEAVKKVKELSGSKNAFTRDELAKIVKNASEAAHMKPVTPPIDFANWVMRRGDALLDIAGEVRSGESVRFEYRMPYVF